MSGGEPDLQNERKQEAGRWLAVAVSDIRVIGLCLTADRPELGIAAYHCQQAAEKLIKGLLVMADAAFPKVHDLVQLGDLAASHYPQSRELFAETGRMTVWGYAYRYPTLEEATEPSVPEVQAAVALIDRIATCLRTLGIIEQDK